MCEPVTTSSMVFQSEMRTPKSEVGVALSSFRPEIQAELTSRNIGKEDSIVYGKDMDCAVRCMLENKDGRISVKAFHTKLRSQLEHLDPKNKGYVSFETLEEACLLLIKKKQKQRYFTIFMTLVAATCIILIAALFGLLWLVVDVRKDNQNRNGVLVDRMTGQPLETASTDFIVVNGVLVSRSKTGEAATNRRDSDDDDDYKPKPLATSPFWSFGPISSTMDSSAFTAIPSLSLAPPGSAGFVFAQVGGFASIPSARAPGSKLVVFFTDFGRVILNGTKLYPAVGPYSEYAAMDAAAILTAAFSPSTSGGGRALQGDPVKYDPITGMDAYGNCVICTICSCL